MERRPEDTTLILDGILRIDDSDRIGQITRNAQHYAAQQQATADQVLTLIVTVQQTVNDTLAHLQRFLATAMEQVQQVLGQGEAQATHAAEELERLLTQTSSAQITQEELDALDQQIQINTVTAQDAAERLGRLSPPDEG